MSVLDKSGYLMKLKACIEWIILDNECLKNIDYSIPAFVSSFR